MTTDEYIAIFWQGIQRDAEIHNGARRIALGLAHGAFTVEPVMQDGQPVACRVVVAPEYEKAWRYLKAELLQRKPGHQPRRRRAWGAYPRQRPSVRSEQSFWEMP